MKTNGNILRVIIAGGGTGGHIFPAIAIANELRKQTPVDILFVGANGKMEMEKVPEAGYRIEGIDIAGFNRSSLIKNLSLPWKLIKSFLQVRRIVKKFKPDAVIGVGGYSSFPVLRYAQHLGIPTFIHESNSFAGKSNKWLGRKATRVFVATDGMEKFFPAGKIVITGNPVRSDIREVAQISTEEARKFFGLENVKPVVLVIGGSLGSRSINEAIAAGLNDLLAAGLQLIWQTGKTDAGKWKDVAKGKHGVFVNDFIREMKYAYAAADMVISRAGAMAIAELCQVQKPVLFVPYPFAAEDHQTVNAMNLVKKQAALLVKDSEVMEKLVPEILSLAADRERRETLKTNIGKQKKEDADKKIVREVLKSLR